MRRNDGSNATACTFISSCYRCCIHKIKRMVSSRKMFVASTALALFLLSASTVLEATRSTRISSSYGASTATTEAVSASKQQKQLQPNYASSMFSVPASEWHRRPGQPVYAETSNLLRVYVYDSLPPALTSDVARCMRTKAGIPPVALDNDAKDTSLSFSPLTTKMADLAILQLFDTYPGRVYSAESAELFVVPYAHTAHCYCAGLTKACENLPKGAIPQLFKSLTYYNADTAARHLFVLSGIPWFLKRKLVRQPLQLLGGNLSPAQVVAAMQKQHSKQHKGEGSSGSSATFPIVIPYLNDKRHFQKVFTRPDAWWTRPNRTYAFAFAYGAANPRTSGYDARKIRKHFAKNWSKRNRTELGGMPVYLQAFSSTNSSTSSTNSSNSQKEQVYAAFDAYHTSIFCPILAGDSAQQSRFFDVMSAGCIPVVLEFATTDVVADVPKNKNNDTNLNLTSWYRSGGESTAAVYPFTRHLVNFGIDYDQCVLKVPATKQKDVIKLADAMEDLILHHPQRIRQYQQHLQGCARRTAFGMGENAHKYNDAFAQIVRMLRYHLDRLEEEEAPEKRATM